MPHHPWTERQRFRGHAVGLSVDRRIFENGVHVASMVDDIEWPGFRTHESRMPYLHDQDKEDDIWLAGYRDIWLKNHGEPAPASMTLKDFRRPPRCHLLEILGD